MQETSPIPGVSIRRRLAVGGMGELFLADESLADGKTRPCVVKRLLPGAGPDEQRLFEREAMALAALTRLATPHVVTLYRSGPDWLLLEWVEGVDLAALIEHRRRRGRPLPIGAALAIAVGLGRALEALAQAVDDQGRSLGLVHRDVHPGNVLLGLDGAVKLADLGVVAVSSAPTQAGLKGTLIWMAPEQLAKGLTSPASDLYAAGLIAYEAFTGHPARPPGHLGLAELLAARSALPMAPSALRPDLGAALEEALLLPLAVEASARPTVSQWLDRLLAAAMPAVPDAALLARLVAEVEARPLVASAQRTFVARSEVSPAAPPVGASTDPASPTTTAGASAAKPPAPRRRALVASALIGAAGAAAAAVWAVAAAGSAGPIEAPEVVAPIGPFVATTSEVIEPLVVDEARDASLSTPDVVTMADVAPADVAPVDAAREVGPLDAVEVEPIAEAPPQRTRDVSEPRDTSGALIGQAHRVRVLAPEGPVHVRGGGQRGLAPWLSPALPEGESLSLHVTGGTVPLVAVVRVRNRKSGLTASTGAPQGEVHKVSCAGRAPAETPIFGVDLVPGGVACRLEASDGRTMSFVLLDVAE